MKWLKNREAYLISESRVKGIELYDAIDIYNQNCKVHKHFKQEDEIFTRYGTLWRGSSSTTPFGTIDPKKYFRKSIEDENFHVSYMSSSDDWEEFPTYENSLIGSTQVEGANMFGHSLYEVIPFDNNEIAFTPKIDIWHSFTAVSFGEYIYSTSNFLDFADIDQNKDWDEIKKEILKKKSYNIEDYELEYNILFDEEEVKGDVSSEYIVNKIEEWFSPEGFGLFKYDKDFTTNASKYLNVARQFWTPSKCLLVKYGDNRESFYKNLKL